MPNEKGLNLGSYSRYTLYSNRNTPFFQVVFARGADCDEMLLFDLDPSGANEVHSRATYAIPSDGASTKGRKLTDAKFW